MFSKGIFIIYFLINWFISSTEGMTLNHLRFENAFWTIITAIFAVAVVAYAIVMMYIFPLMARFRNTIPAMFKNSIILGMRFFSAPC